MGLRIFKRLAYGVVPSSVQSKVEQILAEWRAMRLDGQITVAEFVEFSRKRIEDLMAAVDGLKDGSTKKAIVLEAAAAAFDFFAPKILLVLPWYLRWLAFVFQAEGKDRFLGLVANLIEIVFVEKFKPAAA